MTGRLTKAWLLLEIRRRLARSTEPGRALEELCRHAAASSPGHAARLAGLEDASLADLPVLTKADVVEHFDALVTHPGLRAADLRRHVEVAEPGTRMGRWWIGASSGSSGRPALFAFDRHEWAAMLSNAARAQSITAASLDGPRRVARIASPSRWHLSAQVGATLADPRRPTLRLAATTPIEQLIAELDSWRPTVLNGYASVLGALADAQLGGALHIEPGLVLSGAEPLTDGVRRRIRDAWGVEPHDQYVTTEAGFVAVECDAHDGMHVLEDDVVLEVTDDGVLVTVLWSRTLPLIRYRLDDTARIDTTPCDCGRTSPRLRVDGRARELLVIPHEGGVSRVHPVAFTQVLDHQPVTGWQVVHRSGTIEVVVAGAHPDLDPDRLAGEVSQALGEATDHRIPVTVTSVAALPPTPSGKAARIVDVTDDRPSP